MRFCYPPRQLLNNDTAKKNWRDAFVVSSIPVATTYSPFTGDSGSGGAAGLVPAPSAGDSSKYLKGDGSWGTVSASAAGVLPFNHVTNPVFRYWARNTVSPGTALSTTDGAYGATCWYTLQSGTGVTQARVAGTNAEYALKLNVPSGTTSRWGISQIVCKELTYSLRGKNVMFQVRAKRSEAKKIRIAIVESTGTADSLAKDIINDWTSTTYTPGASNFFIEDATLSVLGTASSGTLTANTYAAVSVSGTVSSSANNLYILVWSEDALSGNQSLTLECPMLVEGASTVTWADGAVNEFTNPLRYGFGWTQAESGDYMKCFREATQYISSIDIQFPVAMRAAPSFTHNSTVTGFGTSSPTANQVAAYKISTAAYLTITGSLSVALGFAKKLTAQVYLSAATSFSGSAADQCWFRLGSSVNFTFSAELGT